MLFGTFGHSQIGKPSPVDTMLSKTDAGLSDSMTTKLVLREEYETQFQIYNHDNPYENRPLALVALHPKEDVTRYSRLYSTVRRYAYHDIHQKFGLSLESFLELPREMVELLFEISTEKAKKAQPGIDKAIRDLEQGA